jgi:hypothetical protein
VSGTPSTLAALRSLLAARFPEKSRQPGGGVPTGVRAIDDALGGGLPGGRLTEVVSAKPSSGGQTLLTQLLVNSRAARRRVALVDAADGFAPETVPPDALRHLVWVRCQNVAQALAAADVLVRDGNFSVVILDARGCDERELRRTPASGWYRLQRATEISTVAVLVQTTCPVVPAVPARLVLHTPQILGCQRLARDTLATQLIVEITRGHADTAEERAG